MTNLTKQKIKDAREFITEAEYNCGAEYGNEPIETVLGRYSDIILQALDIAEKQGWLPIGITAMKEPEVLISGGTFGCNDGLCEISEIADKLEYYNEWRRGADTEMPDTKELGVVIEEAIKVLRELDNKNNPKCSLNKISNKEGG